MHYPNAIRNAQTPGDCRLIGHIALHDQTLSHEELRTIARALVDRESEINNARKRVLSRPRVSLLSKIITTLSPWTK